MVERSLGHATSRRRFLSAAFSSIAATGAIALLAACGGAAAPAAAPSTAAPAAAAPTTAPAAAAPTSAAAAPTTAPAAAAPTTAPAAVPTQAPAAAAAATPAPTAAAIAAGKVADVPRNRTLVTVRGGTQGKHTEWNIWNPFLVAGNHQLGSQFLYEPLAFYSAYQDKTIMWLAESYKYTTDYMQLTVKTRSGIKWSDGVAFSAEDVAYTFSQLVQIGSKVKWGADVQQFVKDVTATDPNTVVFNFKVPAPRFFDYVSYKYDIGVYIAPKHIFEGQDWTSFTHFDIAKGWPVTTSPWKVVFSSPEQKILDLRSEWWGEAAGVAKKPQVQRIVYLPDPGEQGLAQGMIQNQFDITTGIQPTTFKTVFDGNPKVTTWSGQKPPYGYMDWWPHSMYVNTQKPPYNNPDVRWALSSYIDRAQIVDVAWSGAATTAKLPIPDYPGLLPFEDSVKDLLQKYNTLEFNPPKGDALLTKNGFKKQNGKWMTADGKPFAIELISFFDFTSVGPVIVEQLKRQGIDATYSEPPDMFARFSSGDFTGALFGHGGSYGPDPYYTLRLYQTASTKIAATHQTNYTLWNDPNFDKIVDDMYTTSPADKAKITGQWIDAMKIWLPALPDIMIEQGYHRLPTNTTYWTGWPSADDPYVNSAFFHLTPALVVHKLVPVQ